MPVRPLLTALRLIRDDTERPAPKSGEPVVAPFADDRTLGLALQASLRAQLQAWVTDLDVPALRRHLSASESLLSEVEARERIGNAVTEHLLRPEITAANCHPPTSVRMARGKVVAARAEHALRLWQQMQGPDAVGMAEGLAHQLQRAADDLLEAAGCPNRCRPQHVDWVGLVSEPVRLDIRREDHACAIIGAACWHTARLGRVDAWQSLAWRLWRLPPGKAERTLARLRWWPDRAARNDGLRHVGSTLRKARLVDVVGRTRQLVLRPRHQAAATAMAMLSTKKFDAEETRDAMQAAISGRGWV